MIYLVSSSPTRAQILWEAGIKFEQISFEFDENVGDIADAKTYAYRVASAKKSQFLAKNKNAKNLLFCDSSVLVGGKILGKAKDIGHARAMLNAQSDAISEVYTAMIFVGEGFEISTLLVASYKFAKFSEADLEAYLKSGDWRGKAGAMSIEGFNQKYIQSFRGDTSTAMGLNVEILKRYLDGKNFI